MHPKLPLVGGVMLARVDETSLFRFAPTRPKPSRSQQVNLK
jgi:hypothetical protein